MVAHITHKLNSRYEHDKLTATVQTDLSAAFDTVDTKKLLEKLHFYGIEDKELNILESFMTDRTQYVTVDTFSSEIRKSPQCSVMQGSKLSALLYTIYTNEITNLHKIMNDDIYTKMTKHEKINFNDTDHITINYVDD